MLTLFQFIDYMCQKYSIDESHGLKHAKGTLEKAEAILDTISDFSQNERRVACFSAALHDTCDSKYTNVNLASSQIKTWLLENTWIEEEADAVISIITSMSYSKLKIESNGGPPMYPDHGKWQRAYHVARHADLLEGYIVARCFLYNLKIHPEATEEEHWNHVETLFNNRVYSYVKDGWIFLPGALALVPALESQAKRNIKNRSLQW